jgi:hypothetical protein
MHIFEISNRMIKYKSSTNELENLRANVIRKMAQLDIKLPEFATMMGIKYMLLRRIMYDTKNLLYFQTSLKPIADYFKVEISDLLSCSDVPQYIPLIKVDEAELYINNSEQYINNGIMILSEKFVHINAFAIKIDNKNNNYPYRSSTYFIKPNNNIIIGNYLLFKNNYNQINFGKLENITNNQLLIKNIENNNIVEIPGSSINVIGNAVRIIVDEDIECNI